MHRQLQVELFLSSVQQMWRTYRNKPVERMVYTPCLPIRPTSRKEQSCQSHAFCLHDNLSNKKRVSQAQVKWCKVSREGHTYFWVERRWAKRFDLPSSQDEKSRGQHTPSTVKFSMMAEWTESFPDTSHIRLSLVIFYFWLSALYPHICPEHLGKYENY